MQNPIRTMVSVAVISMLTNQAAHAGAFALYTESSAAAIGNYAAGIAAEGGDAAIGWYNPAGLVLIKEQQALISGVGVFPSIKLSGNSSYNTMVDGERLPPYVQSFSNIQGAKPALVPAFHYALPLGENAAFGLSVVSPYGLSTNWFATDAVRYSGTLTELLTVNVSPELAGKLTDNFSVGAGLDLQWARVRFNSVIGSPAALHFLNPFISPTTLDSLSSNQGNSFGVGFHAGVLGMFNDNHTRIGVNYLSRMGHSFQGNSILTGRLADPEMTNPNATFVSNGLASNNIQLPNLLTLSAYQDVNTKWAVLGSAIFTGWNCFDTIALNNIAAFSSATQSPGVVSSQSIEAYRNAWRFALGANYHMNEAWMLRFGGGYDQTPTVNAQRDIRLPDVDRWALSIGAHYQLRPNIGFDAGYTYLFAAGTSPVNKTQLIGTTSSNTINAQARNHAQLVGVQAVWTMDQKAPMKS